MRRKSLIYPLLPAAMILILSCNLPFVASTPASPLPPAPTATIPTSPSLATEANPVAESDTTATPQPLVATVLASHHLATPADITAGGALNYDVDSSGRPAKTVHPTAIHIT